MSSAGNQTRSPAQPAPTRRNVRPGVARSWPRRAFYQTLQWLCQLAGVALFRIRCEGRGLMPTSGGGLICANHQSFFDPVLVGLATPRSMNYLARKTLFGIPGLKQLIELLDAIPIDREGFSLDGIRETLRRVRAGELVLLFPEGTRTRDGSMSPLKPGICALARRSQVPLIPVGIDGAYQAWPRTSRWPRGGQIRLVIGSPISPQEVAELDDQQLLAELDRRIRECHQRAARQRNFAQGR